MNGHSGNRRDVFAVSPVARDPSAAIRGQVPAARLDDGPALSVPLAWYPRLLDGTAPAREDYELIGDGEGIHWPELDEDISVEGLMARTLLRRVRGVAGEVAAEEAIGAPSLPHPTAGIGVRRVLLMLIVAGPKRAAGRPLSILAASPPRE